VLWIKWLQRLLGARRHESYGYWKRRVHWVTQTPSDTPGNLRH
jgi:hypothetical protein